jgi:hypothetical protein
VPQWEDDRRAEEATVSTTTTTGTGRPDPAPPTDAALTRTLEPFLRRVVEARARAH